MPDHSTPPAACHGSARRRRSWVILVALSGLAMAFFLLVPPAVITSVQDRAQWTFEACRDAGPTVFFAAMALLPGVGFPLAPFAVSAGPLFAPSLGRLTVIGCATLAVMINVGLSYLISSRLMRPLARRLIIRLGYQLPTIGERSPWVTTLVLRVTPGPPFFLQSYVLALVGVPFGVYMVVSTLVPLGYISSMVLFGDAIARRDPWGIAGAALLMFVVGGITHHLRRHFAKKNAATNPPENDNAQAQ